MALRRSIRFLSNFSPPVALWLYLEGFSISPAKKDQVLIRALGLIARLSSIVDQTDAMPGISDSSTVSSLDLAEDTRLLLVGQS